jgi:hypothetical protein
LAAECLINSFPQQPSERMTLWLSLVDITPDDPCVQLRLNIMDSRAICAPSERAMTIDRFAGR